MISGVTLQQWELELIGNCANFISSFSSLFFQA